MAHTFSLEHFDSIIYIPFIHSSSIGDLIAPHLSEIWSEKYIATPSYELKKSYGPCINQLPKCICQYPAWVLGTVRMDFPPLCFLSYIGSFKGRGQGSCESNLLRESSQERRREKIINVRCPLSVPREHMLSQSALSIYRLLCSFIMSSLYVLTSTQSLSSSRPVFL